MSIEGFFLFWFTMANDTTTFVGKRLMRVQYGKHHAIHASTRIEITFLKKIDVDDVHSTSD